MIFIRVQTGASQLSGTSHLFNLTFEEVSNFKKTYDTITLCHAVDSVRNQIAIIREEINSGTALVDVFPQLDKLLDNFECEINGSVNRN